MSKKSGFAVTVKAFFPASANNPAAMTVAMEKISDLLIHIANSGVVVDVQQRFMLSREVPDDTAAVAAAAPDAPVAEEVVPVGAVMGTRQGDGPAEYRDGAGNVMPTIPAALKRS